MILRPHFAFESLRILGARDRVKDLDKWQFRSFFNSQRSKDQKSRVATWDEIEAWVCQQRLKQILSDRKENPRQPFGSLLVARGF